MVMIFLLRVPRREKSPSGGDCLLPDNHSATVFCPSEHPELDRRHWNATNGIYRIRAVDGRMYALRQPTSPLETVVLRLASFLPWVRGRRGLHLLAGVKETFQVTIQREFARRSENEPGRTKSLQQPNQ
jgi:hypothetical protein